MKIEMMEGYVLLQDQVYRAVAPFLGSYLGNRDTDELVHDILLYWERTDFLSKYDPKKASKSFYVFRGARNWAINEANSLKARNLAVALPMEEQVETEYCTGGTELEDSILMKEIMEHLDTIGGRRADLIAKTSHRGELCYSYRNIFQLHLDGYKNIELAEMYKVTAGRISQIITVCEEKIKEFLEGTGEVAYVS